MQVASTQAVVPSTKAGVVHKQWLSVGAHPPKSAFIVHWTAQSVKIKISKLFTILGIALVRTGQGLAGNESEGGCRGSGAEKGESNCGEMHYVRGGNVRGRERRCEDSEDERSKAGSNSSEELRKNMNMSGVSLYERPLH